MKAILFITAGLIGGGLIVSAYNSAETKRAKRFAAVAKNASIKAAAEIRPRTETELTGGKAPMDSIKKLSV